jgi:hypothetical protein
MDILTNPRHEALANSLAAGKSIHTAFGEAGYSSNSRQMNAFDSI